MGERKFATEADLCAAFIAWQQKRFPDLQCYAECDGWDILVVYPDGRQLGIQAKLRLNADVILQAAPEWRWSNAEPGPDYRAILVPSTNANSQLAERLGLLVFSHYDQYGDHGFRPDLTPTFLTGHSPEWLDWNPARRVTVPATATDSVAGSPCPITLTAWKVKALAVLAALEVTGSVTRERLRKAGVDPRRWFTEGWLVPGEEKGQFVRGPSCPAFDQQHPSAYAAALADATPPEPPC